MTESITRCPKCKTSFRVTNAHLSTARGAVRCGSCLNIFNARENLLSDSLTRENQDELALTQKSGSEKIHRQPEQDQPDDDLLISDDMPIDDDSDDELAVTDNALDESLDSNVFIAKAASKTEINLFERRIKESEENDRDHAEADESWALNLLDDARADDAESMPRHIKTPRESELEQLMHDHAADEKLKEDAKPEESEDDSYTAIFQILEDEQGEPLERGIEPFPDEPLSTGSYDAVDMDLLEREQKSHSEDDDFDNIDDDQQPDFLESFEPEPLELHVQRRSSVLNSNTLWLGLSIFAGFTLVAQVAYFKFDDWGRQQLWRPYYASICNIMGCTLPVLRDISKIKVDNMVVIDHPRNADMLLVDATIQNRATFDQLFPTLTLTFTDLNNTIISKLRFTPDQYVGGELAGKNLMPSRHPIRITLEIDDPGEDALNYQISIVKP